ncbi:hypothetical protein SeLEV6574_g01986 [Synchytrium endobioticum]|uniref:Uncharacterized protein n=1 Tax=Synchytrium endobioticum TaxID=286115 RepID=A0A507DA57_9FUNG|nr:hypothetical protein SeLEV6574_g01986 [Synchytrium endobioticum]
MSPSAMVVENEEDFCYPLEALFHELETTTPTESWMTKLVAICDASHFNFIYIQALLKRLADTSRAHMPMAQAIFQQLNERIGDKYKTESETLIKNLQWPDLKPLLPHISATSNSTATSASIIPRRDKLEDLMANMDKLASGDKLTAGDLLKAKKEYEKKDDPPDVRHLRDPRILETLCLDIHAAETRGLDEKCFLLAYASCYVDTTHIADRKAACDVQDESRKRITRTQADIKASLAILGRIKGPADLKGEDFLTLLKLGLEHPVICMIVIHQAVKKLQLLEYLNIKHDTDLGRTPPVFDLLDEIATQRPLARPVIFRYYARELERKISGDITLLDEIEFKKKFLDRILYLLRIGYTQPVIDYMQSTVNHRDESLTLYFIVKFLDLLGTTSSKQAPIIHIVFSLINALKSKANILESSTLVNYFEQVYDEAVVGNNSSGWSDDIVNLVKNALPKFRNVSCDDGGSGRIRKGSDALGRDEDLDLDV